MSSDLQLDSEKLIGRVLGGKFRLRSLIGAGASGSVYQSDQTALGRTVAVKILNPDLAEDPRLVNRFHEEALLASRLNHPNTVSVIDYGQTEDGLLYIVMEYLRGLTLTQVIMNESPLGDERIVDTIGQILSGLEEAHHAGVIHADLKSDNVVVEHRRGGWDLVKVVDFGIARLIGAPRTEEVRRTICGTPEYMAPELISGEDPTVASDLYAVGIVLYEILVGHTPFVGGTTLDVLRRQLRQEPVLPVLKRPDRKINDILQSIALRALAKNPADRFSSALEFRNAMEQVETSGRRTSEPKVTCDGCGVTSSARFKFCPECGHALGTGQVVAAVSDDSTQPYQAAAQEFGKLPTLLDRHDTRDVIARSVTRTGIRPGTSDVGILPLPIVGRSKLIDQLITFVTSENPASVVVQLFGPRGVGRSQILVDIEHRLAGNDDVTVYWAGIDPSGLKTPYHPIRNLVAAAMALPILCSYDNLSQALDEIGLTRRDLPGIAELFGHHGELWQLSPEVRRRELFASTIRVLNAAAARRRIVLLLDDVDEYDAPSRDLLLHLAELESDSALRVVVTNGPAYKPSWPDNVTTLAVPILGAEELESIALHLHSNGHARMPDRAALEERVGGSPSHVDHLVRFVVEGGEIDQAPTGIADLIAERLRMLPRSALVVGQTVAVFGMTVERPLLLQLLDERTRSEFEESASILRARGLFCAGLEESQVGYCHRLVRDVIYDSTPANVRRELHAAALQLLEGAVSDALVLGHHHDMAGNLEDAAKLLMVAGDDAVHQLDDEGATVIYQRAQANARTLMLQTNEVDHRILFVTLSVKLAEALRAGEEIALARGIVEEARTYCDGAPTLDAQLSRVSAHLLISGGKVAQAIETLHRAIGQLIMVGDMDLIAEFYLDLASMYERQEDVQAAIDELIEGTDLVTLGEGEKATSGPNALWRMLNRQARLQGLLGRDDQSLRLAESALIHARRVRSRIGSAKVQTLLASYYEKIANHELAQQYRDAAVNEMRKLGDRRGTAELMLAGLAPTRTLWRSDPEYLKEAKELADEVGWSEGVQRALEEMS